VTIKDWHLWVVGFLTWILAILVSMCQHDII